MLFTWDTTNLCIVFESWRITSFSSLVLSLLAVVALTAGYEAVREASRRYEAKQAAALQNAPSKYHHHSKVLPCSCWVLALMFEKIEPQNTAHSLRQGARLLLWSREGRSSRLLSTEYRCSTPSLSCASFHHETKSRGSNVDRLLFMTYNGWIMLAVGFGAFAGYLLFGNASASKSAACH